MDNSILIGKYIYQALSVDETVTSYVDADKIFPLIAKVQINPETGEGEDITFPFIVYSRESLTPIYTKDMLTSNRVTFAIIAISDEYEESIEIANAIRNCLECKNYRDNNITISRIKLDAVSEETIDESYIQKLDFSFEVN